MKISASILAIVPGMVALLTTTSVFAQNGGLNQQCGNYGDAACGTGLFCDSDYGVCCTIKSTTTSATTPVASTSATKALPEHGPSTAKPKCRKTTVPPPPVTTPCTATTTSAIIAEHSPTTSFTATPTSKKPCTTARVVPERSPSPDPPTYVSAGTPLTSGSVSVTMFIFTGLLSGVCMMMAFSA